MQIILDDFSPPPKYLLVNVLWGSREWRKSSENKTTAWRKGRIHAYTEVYIPPERACFPYS